MNDWGHNIKFILTIYISNILKLFFHLDIIKIDEGHQDPPCDPSNKNCLRSGAVTEIDINFPDGRMDSLVLEGDALEAACKSGFFIMDCRISSAKMISKMCRANDYNNFLAFYILKTVINSHRK